MLKGLQEIHEKSEETSAMAQGNYIRTVRLGDGEYTELRFLTDESGVILQKFHTIEEIIPAGKRYTQKVCLADAGESSCQYCAEGMIPKSLIFLWCYVYNVYHIRQNPKVDQDPAVIPWVKKGKYFIEEINGPMVFRIGVGKARSMQNQLIQFFDEYQSLTDRDYKFSRIGAKLDTTYQLIPKNPSKMTKEIKQIIPTLPDLADVILGKIKSFDQNIEKDKEKEEAKSEDEKEVDSGVLREDQSDLF